MNKKLPLYLVLGHSLSFHSFPEHSPEHDDCARLLIGHGADTKTRTIEGSRVSCNDFYGGAQAKGLLEQAEGFGTSSRASEGIFGGVMDLMVY